MSDVYILQNQQQYFLNRQKEWIDGRDLGSLYKTPYKDEAINLQFEISSKDYTQRIKVIGCKVNERGLPIIADDHLATGIIPDYESAGSAEAIALSTILGRMVDDFTTAEPELIFEQDEPALAEDEQQDLLDSDNNNVSTEPSESENPQRSLL